MKAHTELAIEASLPRLSRCGVAGGCEARVGQNARLAAQWLGLQALECGAHTGHMQIVQDDERKCDAGQPHLSARFD